jgi:hypothetical protein
MEHVKVNSSNIVSIGHEGTTLQVTFKSGSTYEYHPVDKDDFNKLLNASSVGKTLNGLGLKGVKIE